MDRLHVSMATGKASSLVGIMCGHGGIWSLEHFCFACTSIDSRRVLDVCVCTAAQMMMSIEPLTAMA